MNNDQIFSLSIRPNQIYSKTCVKQPLSKRPKIGFQDQLSINAGQKYCRMLQGEHSAILFTFITLPFVIKLFVLFIFEWPFYSCFSINVPVVSTHWNRLITVFPISTKKNAFVEKIS